MTSLDQLKQDDEQVFVDVRQKTSFVIHPDTLRLQLRDLEHQALAPKFGDSIPWAAGSLSMFATSIRYAVIDEFIAAIAVVSGGMLLAGPAANIWYRVFNRRKECRVTVDSVIKTIEDMNDSPPIRSRHSLPPVSRRNTRSVSVPPTRTPPPPR